MWSAEPRSTRQLGGRCPKYLRAETRSSVPSARPRGDSGRSPDLNAASVLLLAGEDELTYAVEHLIFSHLPIMQYQRPGGPTMEPPSCGQRPMCRVTRMMIGATQIDDISPAIAIAALPRGDVYLRPGARVPRILTRARWVHWIFSG